MMKLRKIFLSIRLPLMAWSIVALLSLVLCGCENEGYEERKYTLQALIDSQKPASATDNVKDMFDTTDADKRRRGVENLSSTPNGFKDSYMKGYAELLRSDEDAGVRAAAVNALGKSGRKDYLPNIVAAMADASSSVRWNAALSLDSVIGDEAVEALESHLISDSDMDVRIACGKALRHYRGREVYSSLLQGLADREFSVRYQVHATLVEITRIDHGYEQEGWAGLLDGTLQPAPPKPPQRPWWDMMGVSGQKNGEQDAPTTSHPSSAPVNQSSTSQPTSRPTSAPVQEAKPVPLPDYSTVRKRSADAK